MSRISRIVTIVRACKELNVSLKFVIPKFVDIYIYAKMYMEMRKNFAHMTRGLKRIISLHSCTEHFVRFI